MVAERYRRRTPGGAGMVMPGLYRHFKGRNYRALLVAEWARGTPTAHGDLTVGVVDDTWLGIANVDSATARHRGFFKVISAKWCGNNTDVLAEQRVVVYVALYGDGGVWARTEREFEEEVHVLLPTGGVGERPRFERIGD